MSSILKDDSIFGLLGSNSTRAMIDSTANSSNTQNPVQSPTSLDSLPSLGSLGRLPLEVRQMIYSKLMMSKKIIRDAYKLIGTKTAVVEVNCPRTKGLSVTILRSCRAIYLEALPILYAFNTFFFKNLTQLEIFAHEELSKKGSRSIFGLKTEIYGRLSLVRHADLCIGASAEDEGRLPDRKAMWNGWHRFFTSGSDNKALGFPALVTLMLDFQDWRLGSSDTDCIRVEVIEEIARKFRVPSGLEIVYILGMRHRRNLEDLEQGLLMVGGKFGVYEVKAGAYVDITQELAVELR